MCFNLKVNQEDQMPRVKYSYYYKDDCELTRIVKHRSLKTCENRLEMRIYCPILSIEKNRFLQKYIEIK